MNPSLVGIPMATTIARVERPILTAEANATTGTPAAEEADELQPVANIPSDTPPESQKSLKTLQPALSLPPLLIDSVPELKGLSDAIAAFKDCYNHINNHLESIKAAILERLPQETPKVAVKSKLSSPIGDVCEAKTMEKEDFCSSGTLNPSPVGNPVANAVASVEPAQASDLSTAPNITWDNPQHQESSKTLSFPPLFMDSVGELRGLSHAMAAFKGCYNDFNNRLESIKAAISVNLPQGTPKVAPKNTLSSANIDACEARPIEEQETKHSSTYLELEGLCKTMASRYVRKFLTTHFSDLPRLREEVPKALRLSPNSPQLVLECLGKFFLQGTKAFSRNSPMIASREASIFMLECFLLMMGMDNSPENSNGLLDSQKPVRKEAEAAALAWRKRLIAEGGLVKASQIDARGLLMFVACFGIPGAFKRENIRDLVIAANAKEIIGILKNSRTLMKKIPEIVEEMIKNKMEVDAVDLAYTFGLEEKFNPGPILVSFLQKAKESGKKQKKGIQGSAAATNESKKQQLSALKSVTKCLGRHNIEAEKLLPGWQINQKITSLEKEIADVNNKPGDGPLPPKRKADEAESSKKHKNQEAKRSRFANHGPQHHKSARHLDYRRNLLDSGHTRHASSYSPFPSVVYGGPGAGLVPDRGIPPGAGVGMTASYSGVLPTGSYPVVHGGGLVNSSGRDANSVSHYGYGDSVMNEMYAGQPSLFGLTSMYRTSVEGFAEAPSAPSVAVDSRSSASDLYHFADTVAEGYSVGVPRSNAAIPNAAAVPAYRSSYSHQSSYLHQS